MKVSNDKRVDALMRAVLTLKSEEEARAFFNDLCTPAELRSMGQRLAVAEALLQNKTYEEIRSSHTVSSATIARINGELQYGGGGYLTVLERLKDTAGEKTPPHGNI